MTTSRDDDHSRYRLAMRWMDTFVRWVMRSAPWWLAIGLAATASLASAADQAAKVKPRAMAAALSSYERGDWPQAQRRFERLAQSGNAIAHHNLAVMHLRDQSRQAGRHLAEPRRHALARHHMLQAAKRGFVTAQYELAQMHDQGLATPKDLARALRWFERAARNGSTDAQVAMGTAHYLGRGTPQDSIQALQWYLRAANQGDVGAQYLVASMYENATGVDKNLRLARTWYEAAAANGDFAARAKIKAMRSTEAPPPQAGDVK